MNDGGRRHRIYDILNRLDSLKKTRQAGIPEEKLCPILSPPQPCAGSKCVWFDAPSMECWVLNPKPVKSE